MTFSSFFSYPGIVIWHSTDLVNWTPVGPAPEGPKLLRHGEYFYLITAVGGTAGPATGHMVIAARSKSIHGPWEHCPHNPLVRTTSSAEPWWSRGHASLVEGPGGDWWMVYHGYENGYRTLGRQTLLEPMEWTADGWLRAMGGDLSKPIGKPRGGTAGPNGFALSDDFARDRFGVQWPFHDPAPDEAARVRVRLTNDADVVTFHHSFDGGGTWTLHGTRMEVSGIHHNVFGGFLSLKVGVYAAGRGAVRLRDFRYRALAA